MSWGKRDGMRVHEEEPYNAEAPTQRLAQSFLTPLEDFYSRNHGPIPEVDPERWSLRVDGLVDRPASFSLSELRSFEPVTLPATLQCAGNRRAGLIEVRDIPGEDPWGAGATSTASWTGARLRDVLDAAGLASGLGGAHVAFAAPDVSQLAEPAQPYGASIPLDKARRPEVLLAWSMNGAPLSRVHGAPVRVVVPGYIGARSVKWVERVTVQRHPSDNYFQATAYRVLPPEADPKAAGPGDGISLGPVALSSAILSPEPGTSVVAGPVEVSGYAFAGGRHVARVDVSTDGGRTWVQAALEQHDEPWTWTVWRSTVDLDAGDHDLVVRAWDETGTSQPESPAALWNPKGYTNTSWDRVSLHVR